MSISLHNRLTIQQRKLNHEQFIEEKNLQETIHNNQSSEKTPMRFYQEFSIVSFIKVLACNCIVLSITIGILLALTNVVWANGIQTSSRKLIPSLPNSTVSTSLLRHHIDPIKLSSAFAVSVPVYPASIMNSQLEITTKDCQTSSYTVQPGDTLFQIARMHDLPVTIVQKCNQLISVLARVGQQLNLPSTPVNRLTPPDRRSVGERSS